MSRHISEILDAPEPQFSHTLKEWERLSGNSGHDVRLLSDIVLARKQALRELRLDEEDTTAQELYFALLHKATQTNAELELEAGIDAEDAPELVLQKIVAFIDTLPINRDVWSVKHVIIREFLRAHPPKKTLKTLGKRSIDSVLKRMNSYELLQLAYQFESAEWQRTVNNKIKKLTPSDFQDASSSVILLDAEKLEQTHKAGIKTHKVIMQNYATATILLIPPKSRFKLDVLSITLGVLEVLYECRVFSSYAKVISVKADFGNRIHRALQDGLSSMPQHSEVSWKVLYRHFNQSQQSFEQIEQPHIQYDDMSADTPLATLATVLPSGVFWQTHRHTFMQSSGVPVSLHVLDVATNAANQLPYHQSIALHMQRDLWEELGARYLNHQSMRDYVLKNHI